MSWSQCCSDRTENGAVRGSRGSEYLLCSEIQSPTRTQRQERSIKAPFFMHGCLCQKACAGAHHFKGPLPLNSKGGRKKERKRRLNASRPRRTSRTQAREALEDTHAQISFGLLKDDSTPPTPHPHQALLFHKCSHNSKAKHPSSHALEDSSSPSCFVMQRCVLFVRETFSFINLF